MVLLMHCVLFVVCVCVCVCVYIYIYIDDLNEFRLLDWRRLCVRGVDLVHQPVINLRRENDERPHGQIPPYSPGAHVCTYIHI